MKGNNQQIQQTNQLFRKFIILNKIICNKKEILFKKISIYEDLVLNTKKYKNLKFKILKKISQFRDCHIGNN